MRNMTKEVLRGAVGALFAASLFASNIAAQQRAVDTGHSTLTIHVGKTGVLSAFGHEHEIRGAIASGSAETGAHPSVEVHIDARALKVLDPGESDDARAEVQGTMLGPEVLDSGRFNEIVYKSTSAESAGDGKWTLKGVLTLHGQSRPVTVVVTLKDGRYTGEAVVTQTEFGIKPPGKPGIRAKDEVRIEFDVQLAR
jgi:polyisoprenoid-binding protein YceI